MVRVALLWLALGVSGCAAPHAQPVLPHAQPVLPAQPVLIIVEVEHRSAPPEPEPTPASFEPATRGEGLCIVSVVALLEAEEYRGGGPITPALEASMNADPEFARMYNSESHGDAHIQCHYQVALAQLPGKRWRWREVRSNTLRDLSPEICKHLAAEVAQDIVDSTKKCTDLTAGAYWGYVLEPMN